MTNEQKANRIDEAMHILGREITADKGIGLETSLTVLNALYAFVRDAPTQSKARLFDILTQK